MSGQAAGSGVVEDHSGGQLEAKALSQQGSQLHQAQRVQASLHEGLIWGKLGSQQTLQQLLD